MVGKIGKVVVDAILSLMFFIVAAILLDSLAGVIFGNKSDGNADVNGHVMLVITTVATIAFAVWFYKFVHLGKKSKTKNDQTE